MKAPVVVTTAFACVLQDSQQKKMQAAKVQNENAPVRSKANQLTNEKNTLITMSLKTTKLRYLH